MASSAARPQPTTRTTAPRSSCSSTLRLLTLVLLFLLSGITLVSAVGAMIRDVDLHGLVYVFFVLDLLLATLVVLTFGRRERRPARRRATPAPR